MTQEELLQKIEEAARDEVTRFVLTEKGLTTLPPEIGQLSTLTQLDLSGNQLTTLPPKSDNSPL